MGTKDQKNDDDDRRYAEFPTMHSSAKSAFLLALRGLLIGPSTRGGPYGRSL